MDKKYKINEFKNGDRVALCNKIDTDDESYYAGETGKVIDDEYEGDMIAVVFDDEDFTGWDLNEQFEGINGWAFEEDDDIDCLIHRPTEMEGDFMIAIFIVFERLACATWKEWKIIKKMYYGYINGDNSMKGRLKVYTASIINNNNGGNT